MKFILILALLFLINDVTVTQDETLYEITLFTVDARAVAIYPDVFERIALANISTRPDGLIGRNADWDGFYSARFQMGAGYSLRLALLHGNQQIIERAFRSLQAGIEPIAEDGRMPVDVPEELKPFPDARPSLGDEASASAFFLGDACLGIYALIEGDIDGVIPRIERERAIGKLKIAIDWLANHVDVLLEADGEAPNRLLFNARAFQACSLLHHEPDSLQVIARDFVGVALGLFHPDGYFIEGEGWDTNYQAVAIDVGNEVLLSGYDDSNHALRGTLDEATAWLVNRIDEEGRVNSAGNARTCWGQEAFLGEPKSLSIVSVVRSIIYRSLDSGPDEWQSAVERIVAWVERTHGAVDPCFSTS